MSKKKVKNKAIVVVANGVLRFKNVVKKQSWFAVNLLQIAMKAKFGIGSNRLHGKTFTLIGYGIQPYYLNLNKGLEHNYNEDDWDEDIDGGVIWHDGPLKLAYSFIADSKKIIEHKGFFESVEKLKYDVEYIESEYYMIDDDLIKQTFEKDISYYGESLRKKCKLIDFIEAENEDLRQSIIDEDEEILEKYDLITFEEYKKIKASKNREEVLNQILKSYEIDRINNNDNSQKEVELNEQEEDSSIIQEPQPEIVSINDKVDEKIKEVKSDSTNKKSDYVKNRHEEIELFTKFLEKKGHDNIWFFVKLTEDIEKGLTVEESLSDYFETFNIIKKSLPTEIAKKDKSIKKLKDDLIEISDFINNNIDINSNTKFIADYEACIKAIQILKSKEKLEFQHPKTNTVIKDEDYKNGLLKPFKNEIKYHKTISKKEWDNINKDSKLIIYGEHFITEYFDDKKNVAIVPVKVEETSGSKEVKNIPENLISEKTKNESDSEIINKRQNIIITWLLIITFILFYSLIIWLGTEAEAQIDRTEIQKFINKEV